MLVNIMLESTKVTPAITMLIEEGLVEIAGESYPENSVEFYQPIFDWLDAYIAEEKRYLTVNFKLTYFNTSSSKCLMDILDTLQSYHNVSEQVEVNWYYQEEDEDMLESGTEFAEDLDMTFKLVAYR